MKGGGFGLLGNIVVGIIAAQHHTTLRAVLESAPHSFLKQQTTTTAPFKMRRATFSGNGLQAGIHEGNWNQIRSRIYEEQGG